VKIAIFFDNYGPYHIARVLAAYKNLKNIGWEIVGIEMVRSSAEYAWQSQIHYLPFPIYTILPIEKATKTDFISSSHYLYQVLEKVNPNILLISGYSQPAMINALVWGRYRRRLAILLSESTETDFTRSPWKEKLKGWLVSQYQAALVGGKPQKRYLMKLGRSEDSIFLGYNIVDNDVFHPTKISSLPCSLRKPYFLAINRFIPKKNLPFLIDAYAAYRCTLGDSAWDLVLCGDGDLQHQIDRQIQLLKLEHYIHRPGFLQQDEMLPYFAHAKCFIHASIQEQWGLVVNEAMAAGLPVLVSNRCGCFEDLVLEGINGFGFDPENQQQLTDLMLKVSSGSADLPRMGQASLQHIQNYSPKSFAQGLKQAVDYALAQS
jgi:glycosyltransferase involved in cell wall biosynthesis